MPKRDDIKKNLVIGSRPIVIGQACEFYYSGTQACIALKEEGYDVILVNSNPATIMTDPEIAYRTYIEPINVDTIEKIILKEKYDVILPTLGGQTALNVAVSLYEKNILEKNQVELIGARYDVIKKAENRNTFGDIIKGIGLDVLKSGFAYNLDEALNIANDIGKFPLIISASFTLGGTVGDIDYNQRIYRKSKIWFKM